MKRYEDYDRWDRQFFDEIMEIIRKKYGGNPKEMMDQSTFYKRFEEDPVYVQHYPPVYWADYIIAQYENRLCKS